MSTKSFITKIALVAIGSFVIGSVVGLSKPWLANRPECPYVMTNGKGITCGAWHPFDEARSTLLTLLAGDKTYIVNANVKFYDTGCSAPVLVEGTADFINSTLDFAGEYSKSRNRSCLVFSDRDGQ